MRMTSDQTLEVHAEKGLVAWPPVVKLQGRGLLKDPLVGRPSPGRVIEKIRGKFRLQLLHGLPAPR